MTFAGVCDLAAWILCGVVGAFLLSDFIKTELQIAKDKETENQ